ncbi:lectin [Cotesia vestalis bracovirus]|nr:lectin [Cotesia vestalis bracovirus]
MSIGGKNRMSIGHEKSYTFHSTPATFEEAKSLCKQEGGSLAIVTSQEEENKMLELWKGPVLNSSHGYNYQAFIGIHSLNKEGHWETIDGSSPKYVNWSPDWTGRQQPDTPSKQKCGSLLKQGGMDDIECYLKIAFFCEK